LANQQSTTRWRAELFNNNRQQFKRKEKNKTPKNKRKTRIKTKSISSSISTTSWSDSFDSSSFLAWGVGGCWLDPEFRFGPPVFLMAADEEDEEDLGLAATTTTVRCF
jgi:hypothetical protein